MNGAAYCWGDNSWGELGDGTTTNSDVPVAVDTSGVLAGKTITQIADGLSSACALDTAGAVYCWGDNQFGELGDGTITHSDVPVAVDTSGVLAGKTITQITEGVGGSVCALDTVGTAYCWGLNGWGELGNATMTSSNVPVVVDTSGALVGATLTQIASGSHSACAVDTAGAAYCWGQSLFGQLGDGTTANSDVPVAVDTTGVLAGKTLAQVTADGFPGSACALDSAGAAYCWGDGQYGALGNGAFSDSGVPVAVDTSGALAGKTLAQISAGGYAFACVLDSAGAAYCWGDDQSGALGDGTFTSSGVPVAVDTSGALAGKTLAQISAGGVGFACARDTAGAAYCWGDNQSGELGDGTATTSGVPVRVTQSAPGTPPSIVSPNSASTGVRIPFSFTVTTTGVPAPSLIANGILPGGITFIDNGDGTATISGIAASGTNGTYNLTITAANGVGSPASQSFTLTVSSATYPPPAITYSLSPTPDGNGWNNTPVTVTFTCADTGGPGISSCPAPQTLTTEGAKQKVTGTAVDNAGNTASVTATVSIDQTPPTITATASPAPNGGGWNNTPVTVTYTCADALSGIATCPGPVTESADGTYPLSGTATDNAGNTSAPATTTINLDTTPPVASNPAFSADPKPASQPSDTLTAHLTDPAIGGMPSGIATAEYYDPVHQAWLPMTVNGGTATATITTSSAAYPSGMYAFKVRTTDNAGNISQPVTAYLDVYNSSGGYAAGHGTITPSDGTSDPGDTLPAETGNNVRADFNFTLKYATTTDTTPSGSSIFTWGSNCNSPHGNCFSMTTDFSGTVVPSWLIVSTTTDTATFQGLATLSQGTTNLGSGYPVRITTTSGAITGTISHYLLQIYPIGSNPDTATPLYQASGDLIGGQVVVHG